MKEITMSLGINCDTIGKNGVLVSLIIILYCLAICPPPSFDGLENKCLQLLFCSASAPLFLWQQQGYFGKPHTQDSNPKYGVRFFHSHCDSVCV